MSSFSRARRALVAVAGIAALAIPAVVADQAAAIPPTFEISLSPNPVDFGSVTVGSSQSRTVTVTNDSSYVVGHVTPSISGANASAFAIESNACTTELEGHGMCAVTVKFTSTAAGAASAELKVTANPLALPREGEELASIPDVSATAPLTATGIIPPPAVTALKTVTPKPRKPVKTVEFEFDLSEAATVTLLVQRKYGRVQSKKCKHTTAKTRTKKRCQIYRDVATKTYQLQAGKQKVSFDAKSLHAGAYRAVVTATNQGGTSTQAKSIFFQPWWK